MTRKKALTVYLTGAFGQILMVSAAVFILRKCGVTHSFINVFSQLVQGGNTAVLWICRVVIAVTAVCICTDAKPKFGKKTPMSFCCC